MISLDAINNIRTRLNRHGDISEIQLPQAVIAGDQSSGKSSLLEAYSGVLLPFGKGTKTRCPTEIDMHPLGQGSTKEQREFMVEMEAVAEAGLIEAIESAQAKIIGERDAADASSARTHFSSTAIRVHASTEFPQRLTILDMPGLHAKKEDGSETVKRMLVERIAGPRSLIIAVGEAHTDEERHSSFQLATEADPEGLRTIQVFTKCDVTEGEEDNPYLVERINRAAERLLSDGPTARFAHHFVAARPGSSREGWSHEAEMAIFRDKLKLSKQVLEAGVVGVKSLRQRTEALLRDIVMQNVPKMLAEVRSKREEYEASLEAIGASPAPNAVILRTCIDAGKDAISQLGRMTCSKTEAFDTLARRISTSHASDQPAVRAEVVARMSPHEIPWFLGRYAFEKQLKRIGDGFRIALRLHATDLMMTIRPCVSEGLVSTCGEDARLEPAFRVRLLKLCAGALRTAEARVRAEFDALATRNSSFYTRNGHYIDDVKAGNDATEAEAEFLAAALAGSATKGAILSALRAMRAMTPPRSIEDQVVSRVMGDLARVAKAQLKEFLSSVNAIMKEAVVESLTLWVDGLGGDSELRELARESSARLRRREELKVRLSVATENERELEALGIEVPAMLPVHDDDLDGDDSDGAAAASSASGRAAADMEAQMSSLAETLPDEPLPPRTKAKLSKMAKKAVQHLTRSIPGGRIAWVSTSGLSAELAITDAEVVAFQQAMATSCKPYSPGAGVAFGQLYSKELADGSPAVGIYRHE
jgi:hypothetical protein